MSEIIEAEMNDDGTPVVHEGTINQPVNVAPAEKQWFETIELPEGVELSEKVKGYKNAGEYIKGMQEQSKLIGKQGIIPPAEDADEAAMNEFFESVKPYLGDRSLADVPESYEVEALAELEEGRRTEVFDSFKKIGLSNDAANGVMELLANESAKDNAEVVAKIEAQTAAVKDELKAEWGGDFDTRIKGIELAESKIDGLTEALQGAGLAGSKPVLQALDLLARATAEDTLTVPTAEIIADAKSELEAHAAYVKANRIYDLPRNHPTRVDAIAKRNRLILKAAGRK